MMVPASHSKWLYCGRAVNDDSVGESEGRNHFGIPRRLKISAPLAIESVSEFGRPFFGKELSPLVRGERRK